MSHSLTQGGSLRGWAWGGKRETRRHLEEMGRGTEKHKAPSDEGAPLLSCGCAWGGGGTDCAPQPPNPTPALQGIWWLGFRQPFRIASVLGNQDNRVHSV